MTRSVRRIAGAASLSVVIAALLAACTVDSGFPPAAVLTADARDELPDTSIQAADDGSSDAGADADGGGGPSSCQMLPQKGAVVKQQLMAGPRPAATGGTVVPGTYVLTAMNVYGAGGVGTSGVEAQYTIVISGSNFVITGDRVAGTFMPSRATLYQTQAFTPMGTRLILALVCPVTAAYPGEVEYSASATELIINKNDLDVEVFTKQN
jgi:hypothetical protein